MITTSKLDSSIVFSLAIFQGRGPRVEDKDRGPRVEEHKHPFNLTLFNSTEFCTILTQFDVIQGGLKLIFRLHGKNMPNYTRVEI